MSYDVYCNHCNEEVTTHEGWLHWWCCPACLAAGHAPELHSPCPICNKAFSDAIKAISDDIDARVIREGLICVKESTAVNLRVGAHYKVVSLQRGGGWVTVVDDSGEIRAYETNLFRSVGDNC